MTYLSLGSNLGNREENLRHALRLLSARGIDIVSVSSVYETEPQEFLHQPWFLNLVAKCRTPLQLPEVLRAAQEVEREIGRNRSLAPPKGPRLIDIDVLLMDDQILSQSDLTVPHPAMQFRRFVLEPLLEVEPDLVEPGSGKPYRDYLAVVQGQLIQKKWGAEEFLHAPHF